MKHKNLMLIPLLALLLVGCNGTSSENVTSNSDSQPSSQEPTSSSSSSKDEVTDSKPSSEETEDITPSTSEETEDPSTSKPSEGGIPSSGEKLPIGNTTVSGPKNYNNPAPIDEWYNEDVNGYMPGDWTFIYGNNKTHGDFYAKGGIKLDQFQGIQSPYFNSYKKIEVRLSVNETHGTQKKVVDKNAPIFHIYGYDSQGKHIYTDYINNKTINVEHLEGKQIKFYIPSDKVNYFEVRLNSRPYDVSGKLYNFGIKELSIKGWNYEQK